MTALKDFGHYKNPKQQQQLQRVPQWLLRYVLSAVILLTLVAPFWIWLSQYDLYTLRLTGKYRRVPTVEQWERVETVKQQLPKDPWLSSISSPKQLQQQVPVRVISLRRAVERRNNMVKQLTNAGVNNFELVDAVDGHNASLTEAQVKKYVNGVRLKLWRQRQNYQLGKIAADLSHYAQLERVALENKTAIIMEDDVQLHSRDWYAELLTAVKELPQDWQIFYLLACQGSLKLLKYGAKMGERVAVMRGGVCITGYMINPSGARTIIAAGRYAAEKNLGTVTDFLFHFLMFHHDLQAYIAQPFLADFAPSHHKSLIPYTKMYEGMWPWDIPWI